MYNGLAVTSCKLQPHVLETCCSMHCARNLLQNRVGFFDQVGLLFGGGTYAGRLDGCMVPTSLSGWLSSGQSSGLTGAWPLLATAAASWLSSLVAEQPRPRGTQLRGPTAAGWGFVAASTTMCCACKSSRWTRRTDGRDGSRHTPLSRSYCRVCMELARRYHGSTGGQGGQPRVCSQTAVMGRSLQAYCAPPRLGLAARGQRRCGHGTACVNSHPLYSESSRSRSHSLDDQSVSI